MTPIARAALISLASSKRLWADEAFQFSLRNKDHVNMQIVLRAYGLPYDTASALDMIEVGRQQIIEDGGNPDEK